jgi:uncharacterized protein YutD
MHIMEQGKRIGAHAKIVSIRSGRKVVDVQFAIRVCECGCKYLVIKNTKQIQGEVVQTSSCERMKRHEFDTEHKAQHERALRS